jgi:hypothetical protein
MSSTYQTRKMSISTRVRKHLIRELHLKECMMVLRHILAMLCEMFSITYHDGWTGRGGPTAWPPRSPDLNPLNVYLWGHLKTLVYAAPVDNEEAFHRTVGACQTIRSYPGIFEWMQRSMRVLNLMEDILSICYKCTLPAVTHKLNTSGRMLIWISCLVRGTRVQSLSTHFSYTLYSEEHKSCIS